MEDMDNNQMTVLTELMLRKRKLMELREEIKLKSPGRNDKDECSPDALFSNADALSSISPPPFSPLTPLSFKTKHRKLQSESDPLCTISPPLASSSAVNIDSSNVDPPSSPIRAMSPETQKLFDVLAEAELETDNIDVIENSDISEIEGYCCYDAASDDSVKVPLHKVRNTSQRIVDDSETDCESTSNNGETLESNISIQMCTPTPTNIAETIDNITKKNKGRSRKEKQECKILRNSGKSYVSEKGKVVLDRQTKDLSLCRLKCAERFTVTEREQCFDNYWKLGQRDKRAAFVSKSITVLPKKSQRTGCKEKNRDCYCVYKLLISNEERPICKECFCKVLGETKGFVNVIIEKKKQSPTGIIDNDQRGRKVPKNKKTEEEMRLVRDHISRFPAYESHYCRKFTGKKYLAADLSIAKMYREYKSSTSNPVSLKLYSKCFHDLNLSFKQPSKDTCNTCDVFTAKIKVADEDRKINLLAELAEHQSLAEKAYGEKRVDKDIIKNDNSIRAFAFDLQQCLPTPYLKTSVSFYKRQLWSFNLTIHDLGSNEATCYMWDETIGGRGANQIASCLWHFCQRLPSDVKEIIFYSDTCGGQNKNNIVAMMFMHLLQGHPTLETINHKFLISGHTHMECDSDHAIIEKTKKRTQMKINHLNDWVQLVRTCKVQKHFKVVVMTLGDFFDFSELKSKKGPFSLKKIDNAGQKFIWQPVKWLQYSKSNFGVINFKANSDRESEFSYVNLKKRGRSLINEAFTLREISKEPLPISVEKKKDLMDLLDLIDPPFRDFYQNIKTNGSIPTDPDLDEDDPDLEPQD